MIYVIEMNEDGEERTVASGISHQQALENLVSELNADDLDTSNSSYKIEEDEL